MLENNLFPEFPLSEWEATKETLHRYIQIVGKLNLAGMPRKNHWWYITIKVNSRGLSSGSIPYKDFSFDIQFDLTHHNLDIHTSKGESRTFSLKEGLSVSEFYTKLMEHLNALGIYLEIKDEPYDLQDKIPFSECTVHRTYDSKKAHQFWQTLLQVDMVFKEFGGRSYSKTSPVQIYWHHLDIAVTRFSGRKAPVMPNANRADRDAYSHEVISFGFWFGDKDVRNPAFYSYTFPSPEGLENEPLQPEEAKWIDANGSPMAFLDYNDLRIKDDPKKCLLDFLESAYQAGARLAGWDIDELKVSDI